MSYWQRFLQFLYNRFRRRPKAVRFRLTFGTSSIRNLVDELGFTNLQGVFMETITAVQQVPVTAGPVDVKGNPVTTTFPTPPSWSSSDTTILTVAPAADGLSAVVTAVGKLGSATITVSGTPTGATTPITGSAVVQVTSAQAASFVLTFGTATNQVPPPPPPPPPPAA